MLEETERDVDMDTTREKIKIKVPATKRRVTSLRQKGLLSCQLETTACRWEWNVDG